MTIERWHEKAKRLIKKNNLTQEEVGEALGIKKASANHKLNGQRPTSTKEKAVIASMVGITLDELLCDDPDYPKATRETEIIRLLRDISVQEKETFIKMLEGLSSQNTNQV